MKDLSRAERRHHAERLKARTRAIGRQVLSAGASASDPDFEERLDRWVGRTHQHRKACSCNMCCNPRRAHGGRRAPATPQEERAEDAWREERASPAE